VKPEAETVPSLLAHRSAVDAALQSIVTLDGALTYAELDEMSAAVAARLVADGIVKGDLVALLAPNGIDWAVTGLAVLRIGAVLVPLSTLLRAPELLAQLTTARVSSLVTIPHFRGRRYLDELEDVCPGLLEAIGAGGRHAAAPSLRRVWTTDSLAAAAAAAAAGEPVSLVHALEERVRPADDMVVLFTSGSRGTPKGVIHTHGAALRAVASGLDARCVRPAERLYIPMPFFWTGGFGQGLLTALVAGATLLTEAEPEPTTTLELLQRERATLFRGWPDQAVRLAAQPGFAEADLSSLRDGSLAAVLPPERRPAPGARANLFGMTETFGPYCGARADQDLPQDKFGSCGRPFEGVEVRIVDPDSGAVLPAGAQGEIWLRGDHLLRSICGRLRSAVFTWDGSYRTGDLGRLDADGYLWYAGRLDDMVKIKGATVYPSEVEAALRSLGDVHQAFVTDVTDEQGRPVIAALVITDASVEEVRAAVKSRLSAFKVPTLWLLTKDADLVPMTASGKVDKQALQGLLLSEAIAS
jgi:acyl-CoA synthetase (AMP-forming)/AMP-acid ligase II